MNSSTQFVAYIRNNIRGIVKVSALFIVVFELGAIWNEVHQMRNEQVKNATYALPQQRRTAIRGSTVEKRMNSTSFVEGDVGIEGSVEIDQPIEVEVDR